MRKWTKTAGLLFLAAASVYSYQAIGRGTGSRATDFTLATEADTRALPGIAAEETLIAAPPAGNTGAKLLDESTDPFAASTASTATPATPAATGAPTTAPSGATATDGTTAAAPTSQPSVGRSVSNSEVSVSDAGTVEIHVNDANLVEVLRMLSLQSQKNIIASKDVHGTITANLYDVTVREALDAILHANGYAYREKGSFIYVYTEKEIADIEKAEKHATTEVFRVYYTPAADAAIMIKPVLSSGGQVAVSTPAKAGISSAPGGGAGDSYSNNDVLVITDYPENLEAAKKLLADIDQRPQQILLEATVLRATLNEDNAFGVDFNVMGGVDMAGIVNGGQFTNSGVIDSSASAGGAGAASGTPILGNGTAAPPGRVHSIGTGNSFTSPINGGLKVGYVTDSVSVFVAALEQVTDTTILANPKVLALNKQQGEVFVGNEDGYYTTLTTETTTSQSVESLKTGTRLIFRPFIGKDEYVRLEVHPEDSDGSVKANGLPSKSTTEVTGNVMVKDGHTIVIGGLFRESSVSAKSQIPFLGNLPIAGTLFKSQKDSTKRDEVIILLTPHIVKDDSAYSKLSEEDLKRANDLRVGVRKGMMPWGRERLAEGWYDSAKKEMAKENPNRGIAKWELDCATNLNPKFLEAIELKEQLTGVELTSVDNSNMRSFVRRCILNDVTPTTLPTHTAMEDSDLGPTTMPTETADATTQPASQTTDLATSLGDTKPAAASQPVAATSPAAAGTAEASVSDEPVAIPTTQSAEQPNGTGHATTETKKDSKPEVKSDAPQSTSTIIEDESEGKSDSATPQQVISDPLSASPASQPATEEKAQTNVTVLPPDEPAADTSSEQKEQSK